MSRSRSVISDASDIDGEGAAEHEMELQKLSRQYRLMKNDRDAYTLESQDLIKRQRNEIEKLEKEREELEKDLKLIESTSNQSKNEKMCENLNQLGRKKRDVEQEIEDEKKKQQELDVQIREMEKKVKEQQNQGVDRKNSGKKSVARTQKTTVKLEDQLQLANNKFGKLLEENSSLRKEIDSLRVGRQRFDNLYKKLEKEKQDLQKETNEIIDQSTQAYDQRVEAQEKMALLNDKADKDIQQHNSEMKEMIRLIDQDKKLRDFMNAKSKERNEDKQLVEWRTRKEAMEAEKKKAGQTDTVESYEAAFERIKEITHDDDIDRIVQQFIEVEDENFALFNFVNDQNNGIEHLQEEINKIDQKIKAFQTETGTLAEQRESTLKDLENRQRALSKQAEEYNERSKELSKVLDQVKSGINSVFTKIGCERSSIDNMLGVQEGVNDQNLLPYLGIIESRTNQLILAYTYNLKNKSETGTGKKQPVLLGEGPQPRYQAPPIIPPAVGDEYDSDLSMASEDDSRPKTRNSLIQKAMQSVVKRETAIKKQGLQFDLNDLQERPKKKKVPTATLR